MQHDLDPIQSRLADIEQCVRECYAALELAGEGDASAITELHQQIEAMAQLIADLKTAASSGRL